MEAVVALAVALLAGARLPAQESGSSSGALEEDRPGRRFLEGCGPTGGGPPAPRLARELAPDEELHRHLVLSITYCESATWEQTSLCLWSDGLVAWSGDRVLNRSLPRVGRLGDAELAHLLARIELHPTRVIEYPVTRVELRRDGRVTEQFFPSWFEFEPSSRRNVPHHEASELVGPPEHERSPSVAGDTSSSRGSLTQEPEWFLDLVPRLARSVLIDDDLDEFSRRCTRASDGSMPVEGDLEAGSYHEGLREGLWVRLRSREEGEYAHEVRTGVWRSFDPDGAVREERTYVAGRLDGTCVRRESNLFVRSRTYSEGLLHGPSMTWSPNGRILEYGLYEHGRKVGRWVGNLFGSFQDRAMPTSWFEDGERCSD